MLLPLLSFSNNSLQGAFIVFQKSVDNFEIAHKICSILGFGCISVYHKFSSWSTTYYLNCSELAKFKSRFFWKTNYVPDTKSIEQKMFVCLFFSFLLLLLFLSQNYCKKCNFMNTSMPIFLLMIVHCQGAISTNHGPYADTVKRHNVCKRPVAIDTGFKQTERVIFLHFFQWDKNCNCFQVCFWRNYAKFWKSFLTRISIPFSSVISVLLRHNSATKVDQILPRNATSFSHRRNAWSSDLWSGWLVWNQLPRSGMIAL